MTPLVLSACERRAREATAGPWRWRDDTMVSQAGDRIIETDAGFYGPDDEDRAFIAAAREDVPALCRALRIAVEALKRADRNIGGNNPAGSTRAELRAALREIAALVTVDAPREGE